MAYPEGQTTDYIETKLRSNLQSFTLCLWVNTSKAESSLFDYIKEDKPDTFRLYLYFSKLNLFVQGDKM